MTSIETDAPPRTRADLLLSAPTASSAARLHRGHPGGATGLNYASNYPEVDGLIFPTRRRVFAYEGDHQLVAEPLLVAVDISRITLS
jgi:hypothetical protein